MVFRRTLSLLSRRRVAPGAGILAAATLGLAPLTGCAVGVTPTGKSVVGLEVGEGATTLQRAGEFATGIAPILPPPMGEIAAAAGLVLAGGAGEIARRRSKAAAEAEAERRRLEGREEGWDQREAAAAPKPAAAPLPTGGAPA